MTLQDLIFLVVLADLLLSLLVLLRLGSVRRELARLRRQRSYRPLQKKRGRPPKQRDLPL